MQLVAETTRRYNRATAIRWRYMNQDFQVFYFAEAVSCMSEGVMWVKELQCYDALSPISGYAPKDYSV